MTTHPLEDVATVYSMMLMENRPITEEIAMQVCSVDFFKCLEIVNGDWAYSVEQLLSNRELLMSTEEHGWLEAKILMILFNHVIANDLGRVYSGTTDFVLSGTKDNIKEKRQPDVAFVAKHRLQKTSGYFYGASDLVIEIETSNRGRSILTQRAKLFTKHGTKQVWLVFPERQEIEVHRLRDYIYYYGMDEVVSGGDLLPGFELEVKTVFGN